MSSSRASVMESRSEKPLRKIGRTQKELAETTNVDDHGFFFTAVKDLGSSPTHPIEYCSDTPLHWRRWTLREEENRQVRARISTHFVFTAHLTPSRRSHFVAVHSNPKPRLAAPLLHPPRLAPIRRRLCLPTAGPFTSLAASASAQVAAFPPQTPWDRQGSRS